MSQLNPAGPLVLRAAARALRPPRRVPLSEWSADNRVLPTEVSGNAGRWRNDLFPFLIEIMDALCPWHPAETVTFCKSAQVGGTECGLNWMFAIADMWQAPTLMVHPTIQAAQAWVREKLAPSIRATPSMRRKLVDQKSRDGASTTLFKSFAGGYWAITGANSAADISSKSVRFVIKEEWDRWPFDVDGQGDPDRLVNARQTSYHASGQAKTFAPSTPTNLGQSRIWAAFLAGDRRRYYVPCPECEELQILHFFPDAEGRGGLRFNKEAPYEARYACRHCGVLIEHWQKADMLLPEEMGGRAKWVPEGYDPEDWVSGSIVEGKQPSYAINALYSQVTTWDKMAEAFIDAKDDPQKLRTFVNLWLGEPWEERGDAPEWQRLHARREDYPARRIPVGGLLLTVAVDTQDDGLFYETVAWGEGKESWGIDLGFLPGRTADPSDPVWQALDEVYHRQYEDAYGRLWHIDLLGIDSGGHSTSAVYQWVRGRPKAMALKGAPGWYAPAIASTPTKVDVTYRGRRMRRGVLLWHVGTWPLKSELYANLRKEGKRDGAEFDPPGYAHFTEALHDDKYFQQLTAEHLKAREVKGRTVQEWVASGANHYHDCRIYGMALAEHLGVSRMTSEDWAALRKHRGPPDPAQSDLVARMHAPVPSEQQHESAAPSGGASASSHWLGRRKGRWL